MNKAFDISKFRKGITKGIDGVSVGFNDPTDWISTGNYCLNKLISGDFNKGIPMGKVSVFSGESGSAKSFLISGSIVKNAQAQNIYVILIDTENAMDEKWLTALGVDTSEDKLLLLHMSMINDVAKLISNFVKNYKEIPIEERPQVLFVIDSLGMLMTPTDVEHFDSGSLSGDRGLKPKQLKSLVTNCVNMFGNLNIGMVASNHSYSSQDPYNPDDIVSGGAGFVYASSMLIAMKKLKLKEDEDGNKVKEVKGIRAGCKIMKSRYAQPFQTVEILIPWEHGMDPYSGLFDLFLNKKIISKDGSKYVYKTLDGAKEYKLWQKEYKKNEDNVLDVIMNEYDKQLLLLKDEEIIEDLESND
jgi:recombination protein RecA